eukprot:gene8967-10517_t
MTMEKIAQLKAENENKGIIYLSTIPPKMTPSKLKNLLTKHGQVTRMKLIKANVDRKSQRNDMFKEGWIEFSDKKVARMLATIMNNEPMGGKQRDIHKDCLWNIMYLPKFKWHHLMDKLVQKKLERDKRIQLELTRVRKENATFMESLEQSKNISHRSEKNKNKKNGGNKKENTNVTRTFKQRTSYDDQGSVTKKLKSQ